MRWIIHIVVLALLSVAEGSRLFEFYRILSGNPVAGVASAGVTVCIVFYLSFYGYVWASRWATLICVVLSLASFVQPLREEIHKAESERPVKQLLQYPAYNPRMYWNGGKEFYLQSYKLDTERVKLENERIQKENEVKTEGKEVSLYFWHLVLGAVVLGVCVPVLNYLVSHKISRLAGQTPVVLSSVAPKKPSGDDVAQGDKLVLESGDNATAEFTEATEPSDTGDNEGDTVAFENSKMSRGSNVVAFPDSVSAEDRRNTEIMSLFFQGTRATDIATRFNLSRQQIYKIIGSARLAQN